MTWNLGFCIAPFGGSRSSLHINAVQLTSCSVNIHFEYHFNILYKSVSFGVKLRRVLSLSIKPFLVKLTVEKTLFSKPTQKFLQLRDSTAENQHYHKYVFNPNPNIKRSVYCSIYEINLTFRANKGLCQRETVHVHQLFIRKTSSKSTFYIYIYVY